MSLVSLWRIPRRIAHTVDGDIIATQDPEARGILEDKLEAVLLPVRGIGRELNGSLDV